MKANVLPVDPRSTDSSVSDDLRWYSGLAAEHKHRLSVVRTVPVMHQSWDLLKADCNPRRM